MKIISYYDLLNMVKNNKYPSVYYHCSNGYKTLYVPEFDDVDESFICYGLKNNKEYREECARYYLAENILESEMFENNLEIVEDTPISKLYINNELQYDLTPKEDKNIEHLKLYPPFPECTDDRFEDVENKINEIIEVINERNI